MPVHTGRGADFTNCRNGLNPHAFEGGAERALIRVIPVIRIVGALVFGVGLLMLAPLALDIATGRIRSSPFVLGFVATAFFGATMLVATAGREELELSRRQAFLTTGIVWLVAPIFGALPFVAAGMSFIDGYFEVASGLTTTGATVITGLDAKAPSLLLWRSLLQWLGGIGIVVIGIIVMPVLRVGGMQLFRTESSDQSDKVFGRGYDLVVWIGYVYFGLTTLCAMIYALLGMNAFDAVNHAMATISTGGFSTHDASFDYFKSPPIEWAATLFMAAGALPFVAFIRAIRARGQPLFSDIQVRAFFFFITASSLAIAATLVLKDGLDANEAIRLAAFHVVSIVTTTGFVADDYSKWGAFASGAFLILTFIGGCSGSTAGGIKIYRLQILLKLAHAHLKRLISPSQAVVVTYGTRRVGDEIEIAILTFLVATLVSTAAFTAILSWIGLDLVTALSAAATCLANVGPGLGDIIGPAGNFAPLPDAAKAVLSFAMILGRLEFFTLLVLLTPSFWRG